MKKTAKSRAGAKKRSQSPHAPRRHAAPGGLSFADALADVFTLPDLLLLHRSDAPSMPDDGLPGHIIDGMHIRGYFRKAVGDLGLDKASAKRAKSK